MIWHHSEAISVLLPYALILERRNQREMLNALSRVAVIVSHFWWGDIKPFIVSKGDVQYIRRVRALGDLEVLKSYLLLFWSGLPHIDDWLESLAEVQISIQEDFGGIGMAHHRKDLMKWLDRGLEEGYDTTESTKERYKEFRRLLEEEHVKVVSRTPPWLILFNLLTPTDAYRISPDLHVCPAPPVPITLRWEARRSPYELPLYLYIDSRYRHCIPLHSLACRTVIYSHLPYLLRLK